MPAAGTGLVAKSTSCSPGGIRASILGRQSQADRSWTDDRDSGRVVREIPGRETEGLGEPAFVEQIADEELCREVAEVRAATKVDLGVTRDPDDISVRPALVEVRCAPAGISNRAADEAGHARDREF